MAGRTFDFIYNKWLNWLGLQANDSDRNLVLLDTSHLVMKNAVFFPLLCNAAPLLSLLSVI